MVTQYIHQKIGAVIFFGITSIVLGLCVTVSAPRAFALLINPTAPPPGGQGFAPLNSSDTAQQKIGSLVLGASSATCNLASATNRNGCSKLCLNSTSVVADETKCISSWSDLQGLGDSTLLKLNTTLFTTPTFSAPQSGYAYLRGKGDSNATLKISVPSTSTFSPLTALYAEANSIDNFAGYFTGKVVVEAGSGGVPGRLCLNGTANTDDGSGHYCISTWSALDSSITNKLTLQSASPMIEYGNVSVNDAFNSGSFVLGDPGAIPLNVKCGDGMCNSAGNPKEDATNCAIDCGVAQPVFQFSASVDGGIPQVTISVDARAQQPLATQALVVRSTNPNFTFTPQDGITYSVGGNATFAVACAGSFNIAQNFSCTDVANGMAKNTTFYYRVYQGSAYPKYGAVTTKTVVVGSVTPDPGGGPWDVPDDPYRLPDLVPIRR